MYNVRRKLWILIVLLFAVSAVMLKFFPSSDNNDAIATPASAQQAESGTSTVFSDGSTERFVAHRGYSNYAPENSLPAFELAGKIGFWGIETDICETSDGQFVCMHDDTLDRTTNGSGAISDYTLDDLSQFQIDYGNYLDTNENLKIPTLEEYLSICSTYGNVPIIEIKNITNYDAFLNTIIASGLETHCIITGAIDDVKEIRARNSIIPVMTIGYTPAPYTDNLERITEISENRGILYNYPQVDQAAIDILHQQNIFCGVWSVDDTETAQKYIDYGADFIVTNEIPARINHMVNDNE